MSSNLSRSTTTIKSAVLFCQNSSNNLVMMRLRTCGNLSNPTLFENGKTRESLAEIYAGEESQRRRVRFLRDGLRKKISASFLTSSPKACNDYKFAYRKAFWLAYLEHISFCRPILRRDAEYLFINDSQVLKYYQARRPATLTGSGRDQHAFVMQMGNHTFVEFSTGGACYVYDKANCPFSLSGSDYHMRELRDQWLVKHRVIHRDSERYSWQNRFSKWIEWELNIEPLRSYQLERWL